MPHIVEQNSAMANELNVEEEEEATDGTSDNVDVSLDGEMPKGTKPIVNLKEAIYLNDVINNKGIVFEVDETTMENNHLQSETLTSYYDDANIVKYLNPCFEEEDDGTDGSPFEQLARKMEDISGNGGILKLLKVKGSGDLVPEGAIVTVHYSAYLEYGDETYDSTRLRGTPLKIRLNTGSLVFGLELAICTMRPMEVATFLIRSDYAYGPMGCPPRIPGDSTILFNVELIEYIDYAPAAEFESLTTDEQKASRFEKVIAAVKSELAIGNTFLKQDSYAKAVQRYRRSVRILENCTLRDQSDEDISQKLLKKLYLNLSLCLQLSNQLIQSLTFSTKVLQMEPNNPKALYRRGVVKTMLHDYGAAREALLRARRVTAGDRAINTAILELDEKESKYRSKEKAICSLMFNKRHETEEQTKMDRKAADKEAAVADDGFIQIVRERLLEFVNSDQNNMQFPGELTHPELVSLSDLVDEFGLDMDRKMKNGSNITVIFKPKNGAVGKS